MTILSTWLLIKRVAKSRRAIKLEKLFDQNKLATIHLAFHLRNDKLNGLVLQGLKNAIADFKREALVPEDEYLLLGVNTELRRLYVLSMPPKSFDQMFRPGEGWKRHLK